MEFKAELVAPESEEIALESQEVVTPALLEFAPASEMEVVRDSITLESQEPEEVVTPALLELAPDSEMEVVPDSEMELAPNSEMEVVPDSLLPGSFLCGRCHLVHEDRQAWNRAHSRF
jgi:hypothetical protein